MKKKQPIKADLKRCETIVTYANPFTIGGKATKKEQCKNKALYIATDAKTKDQMSMCEGCKEVFIKRNKADYKTKWPVTRIKK